jgi:tetratricopeptide (TPR) repeat protein
VKELAIHHIPAEDGHGPRVRVTYRERQGTQPQERTSEFPFRVTEDQHRLLQWYCEQYLRYPWGGFVTRAKEAEALMFRLGAELFESVFGNTGTLWLYGNIRNDLSATRIVVHANSPQGIAVPWELLRDPDRGDFGYLAVLAHAFVRSQSDLTFAPPVVEGGQTFNVLFVISRPLGVGDIPFQSEARPILELVRPHRDRVRVDVLRPPTLEQLTRVLGARPGYYHVMHFDGHGEWRSGTGEGVLFFEGEGGAPYREVSGNDLRLALAGQGVPIILLNACQSGMTRAEAVYPSLGSQLLQAGASGVLAMTYSIGVRAAVIFIARLYEALLNGDELGRAVSLARQALRTKPDRPSPIGDVPLQDWTVPVLFEASQVRISPPIASGMRLDPSLLSGAMPLAGQEIGCPEPPAFGFVGRDDLVLDLERAFRYETIVLLEGVAGTGKTQAAVGFARWLSETGGLSGPVFFFSFDRHLSLPTVVDQIGRVFEQIVKRDLNTTWELLNADQRQRVVADMLRRLPCILIWDNFEPVAGFPSSAPSEWSQEEQQELRAFLSDLRGGQTKVLLTSRRRESWLGPVYRRVDLGGLHLLEAQELAVRVLRRAGLDDGAVRTLPPYNELLRHLQGNPLAIQLVIPELARSRRPDRLLADLQAGESRLSEDNPTLGRERSLAASLAYYFDSLDSESRKQLGVIALFRESVDVTTLTRMSTTPESPAFIRTLRREDWVRVLEAAADRGLLRRRWTEVYSVHPALPWFIRGITGSPPPDDQEALESAYAAANAELWAPFANWVSTELSVKFMRLFEANLQHAFRLAQGHEMWAVATQLLQALSRIFQTEGRWSELERLVTDADANVSDASGEPIAGRTELWAAVMAQRQELALHYRDISTQKRILERLLSYYSVAGTDRNRAFALHQLGMACQVGGELDQADVYLSESLAIKERLEDRQGQAVTLQQLGVLAQQRGRLAEAQSLYSRCRRICDEIHDDEGVAVALLQLATVAQEQREWVEAERLASESLARFQAMGNPRGVSHCMQVLGAAADAVGNWQRAEQHYRDSLQFDEGTGDRHSKATTLYNLGQLNERQGRVEEALGWYTASRDTYASVGDRDLAARAQAALDRLLGGTGNSS